MEEENKSMEETSKEAEQVKTEEETKEIPVEEAEEVVDPAKVFKPLKEGEDDEFVDDSAERERQEKAVKEEEAKANGEDPKAEEKKEEATEASSLRIPAELEGGPTQVYIAPDEKGNFDYQNDHLSAIENARLKWTKSYRVGSIIKISISLVAILAIILGWIIPARTMGADAGQIPLYIALGCAALALLIMLLVSFLVKKQQKGVIAVYFHEYYAGFDGYVFDGLEIENLSGDVDSKITKEEFEGGKVFTNTYSVGSRDSLTFKYKGLDAALAAAAGQEQRSNKNLATSFVGEFLRVENNLKLGEDGVVIYLKGNDRAIPPSSLLNRHAEIERPAYNAYGRKKDIELIPTKVVEKIEAIQTDKLLVDVTISIQSGRTYFYLGYEDTLMVLPNREHFNPNYLIAFKHQLERFLEIGELLNAK